MTHDEKYETDGSEFYVADSDGESISFRVGPVFTGNNMNSEPGIWITTDNGQNYVLISEEIFSTLYKHIKDQITQWRPICEGKVDYFGDKVSE